MCIISIEQENGPVLKKVGCTMSSGGCMSRNIHCALRKAGLRPTRQRVQLGRLLYAKGDRHVTAESLHEEAGTAGVNVSLATVYNTLNQFTSGGLLRQIAVSGSRTYFDTNTSDHHHYFVEGEGEPRDIAKGSLDVRNIPDLPEGMELVRIDVVVRLRSTSPASATMCPPKTFVSHSDPAKHD